jgi:hypothetical protein
MPESGDWSDLDELYTCPASVEDAKLRKLYEALYARLQRELEAVDLTTGQLIQGSLMLGWTTKHLRAARLPYGQDQGYSTSSNEKEAIVALENILRDWNDTLLKARAQRDRNRPGVPVEVLQEVLASVLGRLPLEVRAPIVSDIATSLSEYTV